MIEEWRAVPEWGGFYEVSSFGRIRSRDRIVRQGGPYGPIESFHKGRLLRPKINRGGYASVRLLDHETGRDEHHMVHRLVVRAFLREFRAGEETCHLNGKRADNRFQNLRIDTHKGNLADCVAHGTRLNGVKNHKAKLRDADVRFVLRSSASDAELAARFGVTIGAIWFIRRGKTWRHIPRSM